MLKRLSSMLLIATLLFTILPVSVFAVTYPEIYRDSIDVRVNHTVNVAFTYGDSATSAELVQSSLNANVKISGTNLEIEGVAVGICNVTMNFNDGSSDTLKVNVINQNGLTSDTIKVLNIEEGETVSLDVDLNTYNANKATVTIDGDKVVRLSKDTFTTSGTLKVTGKTKGDCTLRVRYNTGDVELYEIRVSKGDSSYNYRKIVVDDIDTYYIDLEKFDATRADITVNTRNVKINKNYYTRSGYLEITGVYEGEADIEIEYNTGDIEYLYIDVIDEYDVSDYDEEFILDVNEEDEFYIDLRYFGATRASISYNTSNISLNKTVFTKSGYLQITGEKKGTSLITIRYDTGDIEYLYVKVGTNSSNYKEPTVSVDSITVEEGKSLYFDIYMAKTSKATLEVDDTYYATLSTYTIKEDSRIKVNGKRKGTTDLFITFSDGTWVRVPITVTGKDYKAPTAVLEKNKITVNEKVKLTLNMGSENSSATITVKNPESIDLSVKNYTPLTKTYTINSSKNEEVVIDITGLYAVSNSNIVVKYPEGKSISLDFSVVAPQIVETEGLSKTGVHFKLLSGISINNSAYANGFINGYTDGSFGPDKMMTRAEFATILSNIFGTDKTYDSSYCPPDVLVDWYKPAITKLAAMGVVSSTERFRPEEYITRYEVIGMLYNILDLSAYNSNCVLTDVGTGTIDVKVAKCYNAGILSGYPDGTFGGTKTITRAELVTVMGRILYSNFNTNKINKFADVSSNMWYYNYVMKAMIP